MAGQSTSINVTYEQLSTGSFVRTLNDLSISTKSLSGDSETVLLKDFFLTSPDLVTAKGSTLKGDLVNLLAKNGQPSDHGMVAFEDPQAIGKITTADGTFTVQRNDQTIELKQGNFIYLNDVVESNASSVGIAFADETTISVDPNSKMVIDDFVYDPENPSSGSMNANVIAGNFSFVSGQIAKVGNDAMTVTTPVLTIGVRGTQVAGKANQEGEDNEIVLLPNDDGTVGQIMIANQTGQVLLTKAYEATTIFNAYEVPTVPVVLLKAEVLKKFASTVATTKKTQAKAKVERDTESATREKEGLKKEGEELDEEQEELDAEKEQLAEETEELEEEKGKIEEKEKEVAEKEEKLEEEIKELEEKLEDVPVEEKKQIEKELAEKEEEIKQVEEDKQEIEEEKIAVEVKEKEVEQKAEIVQEKEVVIKEKITVVEQKAQVVEQKFEAIVEEFEVFQKDFAQEFQEYIPEAEIQKFIDEAPEDIVKEFKEAIVEQLEKENEIIRIEKEIEEKEIQEKLEEDPFSEENVEEKMEEIQDEISDLEEKGEELQEVNKEIDAERQELEQEAQELEAKEQELREKVEIAQKQGDEEALEQLEQEFEVLDEEFQELDKGFDEVNQQYDKLNEEYQELDQEFQNYDQAMENNNYRANKNPEEDLNEMLKYDMEKFDVAEEDQVLVNVDDFIAEQKAEALENNVYAQEAEDFFNNSEVMLNANISTQVQDMIITNFQYLDEYVNGFGANLNNVEEYNAYNAQDDDNLSVIDNNAELYRLSLESDYWFDVWVAQQVADDINVAPWLSLEGDVTKAEATAVDSMLFHFGASDANGDQLTYSIFNDPTGKLRIEGQYVYLDEAFDVSEDTTYQIILKVQDPYGASDVDHIYLTVENNHSPEISNTSAVSLAENVSSGTAVSTISASDAESETVTYSITAGNGSNLFTINSSTGAITTAAALDYETATSHTLTITATDSNGNTTTANQVVNVTDVAESANDPAGWLTSGDGSAGAYKQKIAYAGTGDGAGIITELGHTAEAYNANNLDTYDVIAYYNSSNSSFNSSPFSTALTSWVDDGGVLVVYDRRVYDAGLDTNLPGHNGNVVSTRKATGDETGAYQIADENASNLLKYGPGGIMVDDTSARGADSNGDHAGNNHLGEFNIGGGNLTNHGYMTNLDSDVLGLATTSNTEHFVDAVWEHGDGAVYYSTTPTDAYIGSNFAENDAWDAYALNSLHYATSLIFDGYSQIDGTGSADQLYGTAGNDVFWSKDGADEIWSGNGSDTFKYTQTYQSDPGNDGDQNDVIIDYTIGSDSIDISAITNGASISRTLVNNTLFKIDTDNNGSYDMQWELDDYTGTVDQVTVVT